ncbi:MAG: hypothetical protein NTZ42_03140, partial [Candidatus Gribaldobacteria bacterium]|nr:hypothetical protein [Candidatus Gribaldobacteria bacterium]
NKAMKVIYKFLGGFLLVILLAGFLSLSYFKTNTQSLVEAAVPDVGQIEPVGTGFGDAVCDRIIPIGEPLERMVNLLATVYEANQNTFYNVDMASKTLTNIYASLNKEENKGAVCDWTKCSPNFADLGPDFALELDAIVKKWRFAGSVPLVSEKECSGSPCPSLGSPQDAQLATNLNAITGVDLTGEKGKFDAQKKEISKLTDLSDIGTLIGLEWIIGRQEQIVKDLFDEANPTEVVPEDLAQGDEGAKISKTAMIQRMAAKAAEMIKACTLSETEKKMVLSGRMGDRYPLTCQAALENGQYWPLAWSEFCQEECAANQAGSDKCIECLKKPINDFWGLKNVSTLARINYKIYNQCATETNEDPVTHEVKTTGVCYNPQSGNWEMSNACMECLCTEKTVIPMAPEEMGPPQMIVKKLSDNECLAWLCGGSAHNWTCCHQTPIDWYTFEDGTEPEAQVHNIDSAAPAFSGAFIITSYTPPTFKQDIAITKSGQLVGPGSMAVDERVVPLGSCIKIKNINKKDFLGRAWDTIRGLPSLDDILADTPLYNMSFCANDIGDKTKKENIVGKRIDLWLPSHPEGDAWGRREVDIEWWYDPANLCFDESRPYTAVCGAKPTLGTVEANDLTFASGIQKQYADASPALKVLLSCLKEKYDSGWVINSISNSGVGAYNRCAYKWTDPACAHAQNSCHYGGKNCKGNGSMAIDVSAKVGVNGKNILAATCECANEHPELGAVTARQEENPVHYHISVKNDTCACDGGATINLSGSVCKK